MKQKKQIKRQTNWRQRLKAYSTMAAAFTALTPNMLGEANPNLNPDTDAHLALPETVGTMAVQCNDIADITISTSCTLSGVYSDATSIDIDGDGVDDFVLRVRDVCGNTNSSITNGVYATRTRTSYRSRSAIISGIGSNAILTQGVSGSAAYVSNGNLIQNCGAYRAIADLAFDRSYYYYLYFNTDTSAFVRTTNTESTTRGQFAGTNSGYVAVRFDISGNTHLGWIALSVAADANSLIITEWGYEDTPNKALEAGSCIDVACMANSGTFTPPPAKK